MVEALLGGPQRFNDLLGQIPGIAANILFERLKRLEREGLLIARPYSERRWSRTTRTPRRCRRSPRRSSWRKAFPASSGRRYRVRPKLVAIEVTGCHLVPVICGQQPRPPGKGRRPRPAWRAQPQDLGRIATGRVIPGAPPRPAPPGPHAPDGRSARYRDRPGFRGQAGESPGSGDDCSPARSRDCKGDLGVERRRGIRVSRVSKGTECDCHG